MTTFAMAMLVCRDLTASRNFYRNILGLTIGTDAMPHWVDFDLGDGHLLGLHPATPSTGVHPGTLQLGFYVDDVDGFVMDAQVAGVTILQEPFDEKFARMAVIADPDGYPVQIATRR
jgi:catechol 2,3-dioxygenase-like lactoylglutathione lyase family enzyme